MQSIFKLRTAFAIPLLATILAGCDLSGDDKKVVSCDGVTDILNSTDASIAAGDIAAAIEAAILPLPNNNYTGDTFPGNTGDISINGAVDSTTLADACGSGCDEITNNHAITAVLNNYSVALNDPLITGPVIYGDNTVSEQNGSIITITSGSITIFDDSITSINYNATFTDSLCDPTLNGVLDTISNISSIGLSTAASDQQGSLTGNSGTFTFP